MTEQIFSESNKKGLLWVLFFIFIFLLLVVCYRYYVHKKCKEDTQCMKDKLLVKVGLLDKLLSTKKNTLVKKEDGYDVGSSQDQVVEGFFQGFGNFFNGSSAAPASLEDKMPPITTVNPPDESLSSFEKKKMIQGKSTSFPPKQEINGNSDDFKDSDNSEIMKSIGSKPLSKAAPLPSLSNQSIETPQPVNFKSPDLISGLEKKVEEMDKTLEKVPADIKKTASKTMGLKMLDGKCQFYSDKCPENSFELGNFSIEGMSSGSVLSCGNVQNTKPAKAIAKIKNRSVQEIIVLDEGHGYMPDQPPKVSVEGGGGTGCQCEAIIDDEGFLKIIKVLDGGRNYTDTPNVLIEAPFMNSSCHLCCKDDI